MTETDNSKNNSMSLDDARALVVALEQGDDDGARALVHRLAEACEDDLFQEIGKLTRDLHEALNQFQLDSSIVSLAQEDIPDARERLSYVIAMTEQAAHRTLTAVEQSVPLAQQLREHATDLAGRWRRFRSRDMAVEEFRELVPQIEEFLTLATGHAEQLSAELSEVLMAQDFQDITGQIIRRVIELVQEVETQLVRLLETAGRYRKVEPQERPARLVNGDTGAYGPSVPGVDAGEVVSGQDEVDDLLSSLGF